MALALSLTLALALVFGLATAFGASVAGTCFGLLEVRIVGVGDAVAVRVRVLAVVGVGRELVDVVCLAVTVGVGVVRVGTLRVLRGVRQTVAIRVSVGVTARGGVEAVGHFPTVGQAVTVAVGVVHVRAVSLLFGVGQTIAVPVGATVGAVEWVRPLARDRRSGAQGKEERNQDAHELLAVVLRLVHVCTLLVSWLCFTQGTRCSLFPHEGR